MNRQGRICTDVEQLLSLFSASCADRQTLDQLKSLIPQIGSWQKASGIFDQIRAKTNRAHREGNHALIVQYSFEEICAKTIFNLSNSAAPFDADSPYWIIPSAIELARVLSLDCEHIMRIIGGDNPGSVG